MSQDASESEACQAVPGRAGVLSTKHRTLAATKSAGSLRPSSVARTRSRCIVGSVDSTFGEGGLWVRSAACPSSPRRS